MEKDNTQGYLYSFLSGFLIVILISIITGRREAWDSGLYFMLGIPVMMVTIYFITKKSPEKFWRWPLAMAVGQSLAMSLGGGSLNLWPLALIAMTICSIPQFLVAFTQAKNKKVLKRYGLPICFASAHFNAYAIPKVTAYLMVIYSW